MGRKSNEQKRQEALVESQKLERRQWITMVILLAFVIAGLGQFGVVGKFLYDLQRYLIGSLFWVLMALIIVLLIINIINHKHGTKESNAWPFVFIIVGVLLIQTYFAYPERVGMDVFLDHAANTTTFFGENAELNVGGGLIGSLLYSLITSAVGRNGVLLVAAVLIIIAMILLVSLNVYKKAFRTIVNFFKAPEDDEVVDVIELDEIEEDKQSPNLWNMIKKHKDAKMPSRNHEYTT